MATEEEYYLRVDGKQKGPFSVSQIQQLYKKGFVPDETLYWRDGMDQWQFVTDFCGSIPQPTRRSRQKRGLLSLTILLLLAGVISYLAPTVRDGWKEANQREFTPEAAYWKARGFVRDQLKQKGASVSFAPFSRASVVVLRDKVDDVKLQGTVFVSDGNAIQSEWNLHMAYDERKRQWYPTP